ncbi:MAG: hypothetical protein COV66_07165 [Nitrospinae bacterium CG11_big_fil_rev_8_21_14_0_20_45_15]|nr:MAG: hypothetical protein COV66_07165 [Nitrospinae bacterium CG11_big_fil_rev_8_21_14_0_20_45_15]
MENNQLIKYAGSLWVVIGAFLVIRGGNLYFLAQSEQNATQSAIILSLVLGLAIGWAKGNFVLTKTAQRNMKRIEGLTAPVQWHQMLAKPFYGFIFLMMCAGFAMRHFNEYLGGYVVVAAIYCGIGAALLVSSRIYWKASSKAEKFAEECVEEQ